MCGIFGFLGDNWNLDTIVEGLGRLEYRGYDSAGVAYISKLDEFSITKEIGKIENLSKKLGNKTISLKGGIGHTRWATHGKVTQANAHPHSNERWAIVHNGIIENAFELKDDLKKEGVYFSTETDSEVFLKLMEKNSLSHKNLIDIVCESFKMIKGNSAIVAIDNHANQIVAVKRSAPLVCGMKENFSDVFVSSDPYALVGFVDTLCFPDDEILCVLKVDDSQKIQFYEFDGTKSTRVMMRRQEKGIILSDKGPFEHFMLKEIFEQPGLIRNFLTFYWEGSGRAQIDEFIKTQPLHFYISACGTACHAGFLLKGLIEESNRIPVDVDLASEFRYKNPILDTKNGLGLFISQSGETADTLAAQELCQSEGLKTISIINVDGSTLYRKCDYNFLIKAGVEIGVASTKAFTLQVLMGHTLSLGLAMKMNEDSSRNEISLLAERIDEVLNQSKEIAEISKSVYKMKGFIFTGRGKYFPIALEGALKLKEIAYVHAEGYAAGELKHGPIALIDENMVNLAIVGPELEEKTLSNIEEVKARGGIIIGIGPKGNKTLKEVCNYYFPLNYNDLSSLSPLLVNVVLQLFSYHVAKFKGTDIDKPRNLAKSVTVE